MSIAIFVAMAVLLFPLVAWANRPYEEYRRSYEAKYGTPLNPELEQLRRDLASGERIDMLYRGPRVLLATILRRRRTRHDVELEPLRLDAVRRRTIVLAVFVSALILMVLVPVLRSLSIVR